MGQSYRYEGGGVDMPNITEDIIAWPFYYAEQFWLDAFGKWMGLREGLLALKYLVTHKPGWGYLVLPPPLPILSVLYKSNKMYAS